jgi:hypothetical protein
LSHGLKVRAIVHCEASRGKKSGQQRSERNHVPQSFRQITGHGGQGEERYDHDDDGDGDEEEEYCQNR